MRTLISSHRLPTPNFSQIVNVLLEQCPYDQGNTRKGQVVKRNVVVFEYGLSRVPGIEGEKKLGEGEEHVFVKEVQNHLSNSHVVPSAMNE